MTFLRAFLLAALLAPVATATQEVLHIAIWSMIGVPAALVVTHWVLGLAPVSVFGLHAAPLGPGGPGAPDAVRPLWQQVADNALGLLAAALIFVILRLSVDRRSRVARAALLADVAMLLFFAVIEVAYPLIGAVGHPEAADYLLIPELNYGGALLAILGGLAVSLRRDRVL